MLVQLKLLCLFHLTGPLLILLLPLKMREIYMRFSLTNFVASPKKSIFLSEEMDLM